MTMTKIEARHMKRRSLAGTQRKARKDSITYKQFKKSFHFTRESKPCEDLI